MIIVQKYIKTGNFRYLGEKGTSNLVNFGDHIGKGASKLVTFGDCG